MPSTTQYVSIIVTMYSFSIVSHSFRSDYNPNVIEYTREITLKKQEGKLQGRVIRLNNAELRSVEVYLGVPYAAPPVGQFRFMPPSDVSWVGIKYADAFGPVCPQNFPSEETMTTERKRHFRKLKRFLENQSEDCLYLNIYAPYQGLESRTRKYPVMVFIHGESFEWNSGNPYDGSVLAAFGNVIVVTLNFRLGILGFLKLEAEETTRQSNFGLMDLLAALVWVQDNIEAFGGDPGSVTLIGHGTGAVCASLFTISPLAMKDNKKLFHRAILMSGTALSDWALVSKPIDISIQVAANLNCQLHDNFAACLRRKRLEEIMESIPASEPYKTTFGPVVDNLFVPNDPRKSMMQYVDIFKRFELMYGVTELESKHLAFGGDVALTHGMLERERDNELKKYMRTRCEMKPDTCFMEAMAKYKYDHRRFQSEQEFGDYSGHEPDRATLARDELLDILSDARTVAPLIQTGLYHSRLNMQSYFYVFAHKTHSKEYIINKTYNGEDLSYVFGVPLEGSKFHFEDVPYTQYEKMFSQRIMRYFCNFAYTGNPNMPKEIYPSSEYDVWSQFDVEWPEFDAENQFYLHLGNPISKNKFYRRDQVEFWNREFPDITASLKNPFKSYTSENPLPWVRHNLSKFENFHKPFPSSDSAGIVRTSGNRDRANPETEVYGIIRNSPAESVTDITHSSSSLSILLIVGGLFLLANVIFFVFLYYRCIKNKKSSTEPISISPVEDCVDGKLEKSEDAMLFADCNIVKMFSKSKVDDAYNTLSADNANNKLARHMSDSTIDAHTKVRDWITSEIVYKYSPKRDRKANKKRNNKPEPLPIEFPIEVEESSTLGKSPTRPVSPVADVNVARPLLIKTASIDSSKHRRRPGKVSVAIDATPTGRGSSVLMQQPIELTKSLDYPKVSPTPLRRSITMEDFSPRKLDNVANELRKSITNVNLGNVDTEPKVIRIEHGHSKSDPVQDVDYSSMRRLRTFDPNYDINVTSRDENCHAPPALTPEEALLTIKRRNFPKVLPDHPGREAFLSKRRSMPVQNAFYPIAENSQYSSSEPYSPTSRNFMRFPPVPPPRTSTLGRQGSNPQPVCLSEPTLVEEPSPSPEPEITCNNLYVGPLIPKNKCDGSQEKNLQKLEENNKNSIGKEYKGIPRAIVTANSNQPVKQIDPKVVVKATINRSKSDDKPKNIPRVMVPDNRPEIVATSKPEVSSRDIRENYNSKESVIEARAMKMKKSQIPTLIKTSNPSLNKESSSESTSPSDDSDTGTVVKKS
ncbi:neuroligin-4, Y-linked-like [Cylas formicarius]|uniref:neuroligin-4, Y-linked-like n=1 Tax=Cylas formicarius TaxID=197179 RepID=UPI002958C8C7|nr:neuroligin-4, Y-linked-like [Cylas formicarius]XP_060518193.1 neuroligin-4, Y-linked-like [Cylas formicarius]XP_060518194.1 neuroligin-4, Y-linked-like [Cylas formicarius]XP_060518195.1 neuroligin-4, Y-linked-like [Cylas formicarius]